MSHLTLIAPWILAFAAVAPIQDAPDELSINGVEIIVNDHSVTYLELQQHIVFARQSMEAPTTVELDELVRRIPNDVRDRLLQIQAGEDIGFDPDLLSRVIEDEFEREKEQRGGVGPMAEHLAKRGFTSSRYRDYLRGEIVSGLWKRTVVGLEAGGLGRVTTDRYVRPGQLSMLRDRFRGQLGDTRKVKVRLLVISHEDWGNDNELTRIQIDEARDSVLAGEVLMEDVVAGYLGRDLSEVGLTGDELIWIDPGLFANQFPGLRTFVTTGVEGEVSGIEPILDGDGNEMGLAFGLLEAVEGGAELDLLRYEDQTKIKNFWHRGEDERRLEEATRELRRDSFTWTPFSSASPPGPDTK